MAKKKKVEDFEVEVKTIVKPYEIAFPKYKFYKEPTSEQLKEVSEHFLKMKDSLSWKLVKMLLYWRNNRQQIVSLRVRK